MNNLQIRKINIDGINKFCPCCQEIKSMDEFNETIHVTNGRVAWCRICTRLKGKKNYYKNRNKILSDHKIYKKENRLRIKERDSKNYYKNIDRIQERKNKYKNVFPERVLESNSRYNLFGLGKINEEQREILLVIRLFKLTELGLVDLIKAKELYNFIFLDIEKAALNIFSINIIER